LDLGQDSPVQGPNNAKIALDANYNKVMNIVTWERSQHNGRRAPLRTITD